MGKNKIGLQIDMENMVSSLEAAEADVKDAIANVLKASKRLVTDTLVKDTVKANFPAKGKYSTGRLAKSIDTNYNVEWKGPVAEIKVGYDFKKDGLVSVFLMYGTPRHAKSQKIYNDFYGARIKKQLAQIQQESLNKILERM